MTNNSLNKIFILSLLLVPTTVFAHAESDGSGFMAGLTHPIFGLDHLLAMVSVGILSAQLGKSNIWRIPCLFVAAMIVGGILGTYQIGLLYGEIAIALSVVILGISIIWTNNGSNAMIVSLFAFFFGVFHGHAHGLEMPGSASPVYYTFGFLVSTSVLHIVGVFIGEFSIVREKILHILKYAGAGLSGAGLLMLMQHVGIA